MSDTHVYSILLIPIEVDMGKEWADLTDDDFIKADVMAYEGLKKLLEKNDEKHIPFRHYKYLEDAQKQLRYP